MTPRYARQTTVSSDRTITQIKALVEKFGANQFGFATEDARAMLSFRYHNRVVRFTLELPSIEEEEFALTATGLERSPSSCHKLWETACRSKWRGLFILIKALLNAIEEGLIDFDRAFMHDIVTPDGRTVGEHMIPEVQKMLDSGKATPLLLPLNG